MAESRTGGATPSGTRSYFEKHPLSVPPIVWEKTGWTVSPVGFGGYRIHDREEKHREALRLALTSGCNLIDTSTNYTNGGSELLIGQVLRELLTQKKLNRDDVVVVTKAGYVQGDNLVIAQRRIAEGSPFPEMVEFDEECWHCISPQFLEDQLARSLQRLGLEKVDVLLLHNPEYFLKAGGHIEEYYRRIRQAFEFLESQVKAGKIQYYGISSNTFPSPKEDPDATSFETVLEIAQSISKDHHFAVIQFPFNLLEPGAALEPNNSGRSVLEAARLAGIATLINRPLNAFSHQRLVRLANFPITSVDAATRELEKAMDQAISLETEFPPGASPQHIAWGHILQKNLNRLSSLDTWKEILNFQARPALQSLRAALGDTVPENGRQAELNRWLDRYTPVAESLFSAMTAYLQSLAASDFLHIIGQLRMNAPELDQASLSASAVRLYRSVPGASCILVGMRSPEYVRDILDLAPKVPKESAIRALHALQRLDSPSGDQQ